MAGNTTDDDFATEPVPLDQRIAWPLLFFAEMGVATALIYMQITSVLTMTFGTRVALVAIGYGAVVSSLVGFGICHLASNTGFGCNLLARRVLGSRGAVLFSLIFGANTFVYFAIEATIMGTSLKQFFPALSLDVILPVIAIVMVPLVWFGMRLLARAQLLTFAIYCILLVAAIVHGLALPAASGGWLEFKPSAAPSTLAGIMTAISTMNSIVFITSLLIADYARFIRPSENKVASLFLGCVFQLFCFVFSGALGIWFALRFQDSNPGSYFVTALGGWGVLFAFSTQLRINLANMYSGALAVLNILAQLFVWRASRHFAVAMFGIAVVVALSSHLFDDVTKVLSVLGLFTTCFTCLLLAECFIINRSTVGWGIAVELPWKWSAIISLCSATTFGCFAQSGLMGGYFALNASLIAAALVVIATIAGSKLDGRRGAEK